MKLLLPLLLALTFSVASNADAHSGVNGRQWHQSARIDAGIARGALTPAETARLGARQARIGHIERHYRADGYLGPYERADLQRRLNRSSAAIWRQTHDRQRW
ncbi:MAG: hypothetical protein IPO66_17075 [Rhodanobacteraceae bacterium]|nr:hypothetical protein [Rhodanobacteraceae bacterium]